MSLLTRIRARATGAHRASQAPPLPPASPQQCAALNARGRRCGFQAAPGSDFCPVHKPPAGPQPKVA